ncbi:2Fe-2S iron-sulfur cluster binding domain-containing protein [bacterium]|nr:2Fe-2S iron-sulfur cluster binding domain-containing protein [bacterium]
MHQFYQSPLTLADALALKAQHGDTARIIAGGTDLIIEMDRHVRSAPDGGVLGLIDLTRVPGLAEIWEADGWIHLGALVTHNQCVASSLIVDKAFPLARACWEVGAPQIRNRGTVAGNIITASPANDSIVPLRALNATLTVQSAARGARTLPIEEFVTGFRRVDLVPDEIVVRVSLRPMSEHERGNFLKLGLRRAQAISVNTVAAVVEIDPNTVGSSTPVALSARISLGAVAPVIVRADAAESFLAGKALTEDVIAEAARLAAAASSPIDDIRGSGEYRRAMVETLTARLLRQIREGRHRHGWLARPVLLWGATGGKWPVAKNGEWRVANCEDGPIRESDNADHNPQPAIRNPQPTTVNGQPIPLPPNMTLLDSLREAGFVGVKEGCAEGECGACTVFLDGMAVMACLVPAERAAGSEVVTVEGLADGERLHAVQAAFVQSGGVQCGYCTPGFLMSAAKLLEERPHPTRGEAQEALTGNLCRCTGYRKILDAVVLAGGESSQSKGDNDPTEH